MSNIETIESSEFETKVLQAQQPVVLDFYQATCAPCRALKHAWKPWHSRMSDEFLFTESILNTTSRLRSAVE